MRQPRFMRTAKFQLVSNEMCPWSFACIFSPVVSKPQRKPFCAMAKPCKLTCVFMMNYRCKIYYKFAIVALHVLPIVDRRG